MNALVFKNLIIIFLLVSTASLAQVNPVTPNIGFEDGTFTNWDCKTGMIDASGTITMTADGPFNGRQTLFSKALDSKTLDPYGNFPVVCPNGSKYSIRLGNEQTGKEAESVSYTFTVPNTATYSIVFNYAVVLQNPSHAPEEQPKFTAQVYDVTDSKYVECPSFDFVAGTALPGFKLSTAKAGAVSTDIYYKDWSTATIDLRGYLGKTLRLEFTTNDCTKGGHFGYAYLDVAEGASGVPITGNSYCATQNSVTLKGPTGFSDYNWYNADMTKLLYQGQTFKISPAPPDLTKYALEVYPYAGLGCVDTLYTVVNKIDEGFKLQLVDTVHGCKDTGADLTALSVTAGSSAGMTYSYYTDDSADNNYVHDPTAVLEPGTYYIKGINAEGCEATLPVQVSIGTAPLNVTNPASVRYPATVDLTKTFIKQGNLNYSYYSDPAATQSIINYTAIDHSGTFYIKGENSYGCESIVPVVVTINPPPPYVISAPNAFTPNNDGINDHFNISLQGYVEFSDLKIFNRYGELIFQAKSPSEYWDGAFKGHDLPVGTYYWLFNGTDTYYHTKATKSGSITIVR